VLDLALCRTSVARRTDIFHFEWLREEEVAVAVSPMHALSRTPDVGWEQVAQYPWILFPGHMPLRTLLEREAASNGVVLAFRPVETSSTFATALLLNKSPDMVALMSLETLQFRGPADAGTAGPEGACQCGALRPGDPGRGAGVRGTDRAEGSVSAGRPCRPEDRLELGDTGP
jgi:hypothetical protein